MQRRTVYFAGNVQGVGFRYTARRIAAGYTVVGFVRNLPDGRVECVVEGEPTQIDAFLSQIQQSMRHYIDACDQHQTDPLGDFDRFEIRY